MPKDKKKSALSKARKLFIVTKHNSEEEEDTSSDHSEEYSHIPLKTEIPLLTSLSIDDSENTIKMEQLAAEINGLATMLRNLTEQQNQQQLTLNTLIQNAGNVNQDHISPVAGNLEIFFQNPRPH